MMTEQTTHAVTGEGHKSHGRHLHGARLWVARLIYLFQYISILTFFVIGFPVWLNGLSQGGIGVTAFSGAHGGLVLYVYPNSDAAKMGIQMGDTLIAIDGTGVTSAAKANQMLIGRAGDPINLTVLGDKAVPRQYSLIFAGGFLQLLAQMHLSLQFLVIYNIVLTSVLALAVILSSPLVFIHRSKDWLVILIAFSMITFASFFMAPVKYGTLKLHIGFMNNLIYMVGMVSMCIVFFIFPSGHFQPRWMRWVAIFLFIPAVVDFWNLQTINDTRLDFFLWIGFFALATFAQVNRYRRVATSIERPQTKQVVFGMVACFLMLVILNLVIFLFAASFSNAQYVLFALIVEAGAYLPVVALDWSFVSAIYHYRLWDTDLYINRTLVYTLVTVLLVLIWVVTTQVLNYAFQQILGQNAGWLGALLSSLQVAVIYRLVRKWVEKWVNSRFYKDRIDYSEALVELRPEMWNYLTTNDLIHTLVTTVPALLQSMSGALFIQERRGTILIEAHNIHPSDANKFQFTEEIRKKLESANVIYLPEGGPFAILVPLTVSRLKVYDLVGILAIGPRSQGRGYSRDHLNDLTALGRNAGTALYMLKLNEQKRLKEMPLGMEG